MRASKKERVMKQVKVSTINYIEVPDDTTHYTGNLLDNPSLFKMIIIGGGEHWFRWHRQRSEWGFYGHYKPHFLRELGTEHLEELPFP